VYVARDEDDAAGTRLGGLIANGHLIEALDDEQNLFLFKMDMVGRAFAEGMAQMLSLAADGMSCSLQALMTGCRGHGARYRELKAFRGNPHFRAAGSGANNAG
jgi:hypothetical protein